MKNTLRKIFSTPRFLVGFVIFFGMLLFIMIYPLFVPGNPLEMIGLGTFFRPGTYVSLYDGINAQTTYTLKLSDAAEKRIDYRLLPDDRASMREWLVLYGVPEEDIDIGDTEALLALWSANYDSSVRVGSMTTARRQFFQRLDRKLDGLLDTEDMQVMAPDPVTGEATLKKTVTDTDYLRVGEVANVRFLPLGTDNFGRDVLKQLVSAMGTSLWIGLIAGSVATMIGLTLGLLGGYVGGIVDDIIMFFCNIFTVIPSFVLLILISYSIGQGRRGAVTVAVVIGFTSWVWTARSVRSQVISLRDRDHVNLSKLSGHSLAHIIATDILPYIASYVVMAFILQISTAIL
ncbi:MAG: ABC transporter permease subunit, partial [Oscillospiraceae bacterium]|nr:ABC transporter permease subunit [Oscillospiraceae bacterium]